jgi:tRNA 2-selenouridine synthase
MAITLHSIADLATLGFDDIIDVRAPAEFAEDHMPGAVNLPVLDDAERAKVGTIYKQDSPFLARKLGAALVARNAAHHLETALLDKLGGWRPLVYCWRGGQRSGSFASILAQIGWRVEVVQGGYKSWRRLVVQALFDDDVPCRVVVLDGDTGTAKTDVLNALRGHGVQVIDLEGLAHHRGSLFGGMPGGQPSQKAFESALAVALSRLDPARPVVVEAESAKIGNVALPSRLWRAMVDAPRVAISAPLGARAAYLVRAYADMVDDRERLEAVVASLRQVHAGEVIAGWQAMVAVGDDLGLATGLMAAHYDPRYAKHRARMGAAVTVVEADGLDEADVERLAGQVAGLVAGM